jgi:hypothetical protein
LPPHDGLLDPGTKALEFVNRDDVHSRLPAESACGKRSIAGGVEKIAPRRFFVNPARMRILFAL